MKVLIEGMTGFKSISMLNCQNRRLLKAANTVGEKKSDAGNGGAEMSNTVNILQISDLHCGEEFVVAAEQLASEGYSAIMASQ